MAASCQGISMKTLTFQVIEGVDKGRIFRELPIPVTIGREEGNLLRLAVHLPGQVHALHCQSLRNAIRLLCRRASLR